MKVRTDERRKAEGKKSEITTCQGGTSDGRPINPSTYDRMRGYIRVGKHPPTNAGKRHAQRQEAEIRKNAEGEIHVRVVKVYCHDTEEKGNYWTVWVKKADPDERTGMEYSYGRTEVQGELWKEPTTTGRAWMKDRTAAKEAVDCPKCNAPAGAQCTTQPNGEGDKTNPHKARVFAYYDTGAERPEDVKADRLGRGHGGY